MSATTYDVVVAGGGIVGLVSAVLLADAGLHVCVLEPLLDRNPPEGAIGIRTYALTPGTRAVLERVGAWQALDHMRIGPFARMEVWDAGSSGRIHFDPPPPHAQAMGWIVEHQNLLAALARTLAARPAITWRPTAFADWELTRPLTISCGDGARLTTELLLGADGAGSRVREAAGIAVSRHSYRQRAIVCNVTMQASHGQVARQCFLRSGPLAFLPLPAARQCAVVWSCDAELASDLEGADEADFAARLTAAFDSDLGDVSELGPRMAFPLERSHARQVVSGACVLLGDAAHVVHPLAGQGLNLGIMDAAALSQCLGGKGARTAWPPSAALRRYERWRKSEALAMTVVTDGLQRLFQRQERPLRLLRGAGMNLTERMLPLKHWLIARAMGVAGDVPLLASRRDEGADPSALV